LYRWECVVATIDCEVSVTDVHSLVQPDLKDAPADASVSVADELAAD
jgi:hypothetical protein